jgi:membrane protein DedA with SNARE-associated domain
MTGFIHATADWLVAHNLQTPLFILLLLFAFLEAAVFLGFVLPGETSLLIGGVLAHSQVWSFWLFLICAIIAAVCGDSVGYEVGKHFGTRIRRNRLGQVVGEKRWLIADHIFSKYHGGAIFFGRAQALLRALIPALAGIHNVPYRTFLKWNVAGGIFFSSLVVTMGYVFANSLPTLEKYLKFWAIGFLAIVTCVVILIKRNLERKIVNESS